MRSKNRNPAVAKPAPEFLYWKSFGLIEEIKFVGEDVFKQRRGGKMALFTKDKFECARCSKNNEPLGYAPVPTELGERVGTTTCGACWQEWLQKQNQLINHFGLDVSKPDTHEYLFDQMKLFFFDEGEKLEDIDESKEGSVSW